MIILADDTTLYCNINETTTEVIIYTELALTETWLKPYHSNYVIPNYNFEQDLRMHSRGRGGVCLYLHSTLPYRIRNDLRLVSSGKLKHSKCNPSRKKHNSQRN